MQRKIYGMGMLAALLTFALALAGCDNPAATRDAEAPDGTLASPVPRVLVTTEGLYVGEEYLSPIALDDQTGDNVVDKALAYINAQTLTETTQYIIVLGGGHYVIPGTGGYGTHSGSPNITVENAVITLVGLCPAEISVSAGYNHSLFWLNAGTLVLDNNITLKGRDDIWGAVVVVSPLYGSSQNAVLAIKDGAKITGNNSTGHSGGVYVSNGGSLVMEGGAITGNTAKGSGGGVYIWDGSLVMNGGEISGNNARTGGGVYTQGKSSVTIRGGKISGNTAVNGGGIWSSGDSAIIVEGGEISGNTATIYGGGIMKYYGGELFSKTGGVISGNTLGGLLYLPSGEVYKDTTGISNFGVSVYYLMPESNGYDYCYNGDLGEEDTISTDDLSKWSRNNNLPW